MSKWIVLTIVCIIAIVYFNTHTKTNEFKAGNYETENFKISGGKSYKNAEILQNMKVPLESVKLYLMMEDEFLQMEKDTVCRKNNKLVSASILSQDIKEKFPYLNFDYHQLHIQQMASPNKFINRNLTC
jgi:hypothetical protein